MSTGTLGDGYPYQPAPTAKSSSNGFGLAGFICSLIALCAVPGCLSPVALILSLIGLAKAPRGFAITGTVLSLVGVCGCGWITIPLVLAMVGVLKIGVAVAAIGGALALFAGKYGPTVVHLIVVLVAISTYQQQKGVLPPSLADLQVEKEYLVDGWGQPFTYELASDGRSFVISSNGPDTQAGTQDDIALQGDLKNGTVTYTKVPPGRTPTFPMPVPPAPVPPPVTPPGSGGK